MAAALAVVALVLPGRAAAAVRALLADRLEGFERREERIEAAVRDEMAKGRAESGAGARELREEVRAALEGFAGNMARLAESNESRIEKMRQTVEGSLRALSEENANRLDQMRQTVDEKLQGTLEKRLGESFRLVSERLEAVQRGLGEMQTLATGVGDLKKVLANVKVRVHLGRGPARQPPRADARARPVRRQRPHPEGIGRAGRVRGWVLLNCLGIERTTTESTVTCVGDVHLAYMPYSHSVATMGGAAILAWLAIGMGLGEPDIGAAVSIGIGSDLVLDLITHRRDIALAPGLNGPKLGLGLYENLPFPAFILEIGYGVFCWWVYQGSAALLAAIIAFNAANLSMFVRSVPGIERRLANRPRLIVTVILVQITVTLVIVGLLS